MPGAGPSAGGYYDSADVVRARVYTPRYTYLLRVFIIAANGIFVVTTLKRVRAPIHRRDRR